MESASESRHPNTETADGEKPSVADVHKQLEALSTSSGLVERRELGVLKVTGEDRSRFINAYISSDVSSLSSGEGCYGFFTSSQGRILSDAVVLAAAEVFLIAMPSSEIQPLVEHLEKFVIVDRVGFEEISVMAQEVAGPDAGRVLREAGFEVPESLFSWTGEIATGLLVRERAAKADRWVVLAEPEKAQELRDQLAPGTPVVSVAAHDHLFVQASLPRFGREFGVGEERNTFPQETGLEDAVSYTKGCYLGQEVVARIHYRGAVNRKLCTVSGPDLAEGATLFFDSQEVGRVGSVAGEGSKRSALVILHRKATTVGTEVTLSNGERAVVVEGPQ